jgi:putative ABC transport system permease protein
MALARCHDVAASLGIHTPDRVTMPDAPHGRAAWRTWADDFAQDFRFGLRSARHARLFTALAVVTIGLGLGVNAAVFGVVKSVLLDALPYADASRLVRVYSVHQDSVLGRTPLSAGDAADIAARARSLARTASFRQSTIEQTYVGADGAQIVSTATIGGGFFGTLGVHAALGRIIGEADVAPNAPAVAMLSDDAWKRLFGGDRGVIGRSVRLEGSPYVVVGVLPRRFVGPMGSADFWVPLDLKPFLGNPIGERRLRMLGLVGRLAPNATADVARRELATIARDLAREHPESDGSFSLSVLSLRDDMVGDTRRPLVVVMASAALVLLIACANLAGALLTRTVTRRREFAVRAAIGAGSGRLVRQLLTESMILALTGGVAGTMVALLGLRAIRAFAGNALPAHATVSADGGVLLFAFVLALITGVAFGLAPARSVTRNALQEATRGAIEGRASRRLRGALVAGQIAFSISLLAGAGLLARSLWALTTTPLGFDPSGVLTLPIRLPAREYRTPDARSRFYEQLEERLRGLPGVTGVATTTAIPRPVMGKSDFRIDGVTWSADAQPFANVAAVSDDYFRTMRIALREGRTFGPEDRADSVVGVVVSAGMARRFWSSGRAIGARIRVGPNANAPWSRVIGIVDDVRNDPARGQPEPTVYSAVRRTVGGARTVVIRTACPTRPGMCDDESLMGAVRREVVAIDPNVPADRVAALGSLLAAGLAGRRLPVALLVAFGGLALLLASVGVYTMVAAMGAAREREFGVRLALGSSPGAIASLVLRQTGLWVAVGLALGGAGVVGVTRAVRGLLYGVSPFDPVTLGLAVALLLLCSAIALVVPVRRAARVDPISVLR